MKYIIHSLKISLRLMMPILIPTAQFLKKNKKIWGMIKSTASKFEKAEFILIRLNKKIYIEQLKSSASTSDCLRSRKERFEKILRQQKRANKCTF